MAKCGLIPEAVKIARIVIEYSLGSCVSCVQSSFLIYSITDSDVPARKSDAECQVRCLFL